MATNNATARWSVSANGLELVDSYSGSYLCAECGELGDTDDYYTDGDNDFCQDCFTDLFGED